MPNAPEQQRKRLKGENRRAAVFEQKDVSEAFLHYDLADKIVALREGDLVRNSAAPADANASLSTRAAASTASILQSLTWSTNAPQITAQPSLAQKAVQSVSYTRDVPMQYRDDIQPLEAPDPQLLKRSATKHARKKACEKKVARDMRKYSEIYGHEPTSRMSRLGNSNLGMTGRQCVERECLMAYKDVLMCRSDRLEPLNLDPEYVVRTNDPIGLEWRLHCEKYRLISESDSKKSEAMAKIQASARWDAANLIDNCKVAEALKAEVSVPAEFQRAEPYHDVSVNGNFRLLLERLSDTAAKVAPEFFSHVKKEKDKGNAPVSDEVERLMNEASSADSAEFAGELKKFGNKLSSIILIMKNEVRYVTRYMNLCSLQHSVEVAYKTVLSVPPGMYRDMMEEEIRKQLDTQKALTRESYEALSVLSVDDTLSPEMKAQKMREMTEGRALLDEMGRHLQEARGTPAEAGINDVNFASALRYAAEGLKYGPLITEMMRWERVNIQNEG